MIDKIAASLQFNQVNRNCLESDSMMKCSRSPEMKRWGSFLIQALLWKVVPSGLMRSLLHRIFLLKWARLLKAEMIWTWTYQMT
ncbi:LOW QUALITY PROTEIN: hypothetical protein AQUCO_00500347v1 [Aquilegia coerulea]|uniref:Uncharacterized protein n=1 Tax=Aquilegia coerulea TaxID=218851 RepID=A0A2G5ERJ8_AQUCA|nr:LOW QUALITY PROTEIN: hypothetical protein AQUCO_00500347v1 [Aquilegia coerulea]